MVGFFRGRLRVALVAAGVIAGAGGASAQAPVVVAGIVTDAAGKAAGGVTVTLRDRSQPARPPRVAVSDIDGRFRLPDVPQGDYVASVENRRRRSVDVLTVRVGEEPATEVRLTLPWTAAASRGR